ncbi:alpha/beta hydrolase family protein [Phenylobacterium parvum]|nr:hypothetical protein [Phenylobacterium parvum]
MVGRVVLGLAGVSPEIPVQSGFTPYRLTYWSETNGAPVLVSALVSVPNGKPPRGLVLWMHGTNPARSASISSPSLQEGVAVSAAFTGGGYALIAPDLIGLGVSHSPQAYLYNPSTLSVTLDLLEIVASGLGGRLPADVGEVFIAGFSQGGHDAAVIQRALESAEHPSMRVRATAAIAGAYDLAGISIPFALKGRSEGSSTYLGLAAQSWATYYGHPLETLMTAPATKLVREALDGSQGANVLKLLPRDPREMFRSDFLDAQAKGGNHWFLEAARANEAWNWTPKAPFRAYFGTRDVDVSPQESIVFAETSARRGGNATAVAVGPFDHGQSVLHAVPLIRKWFDELGATA